MAATQRSNSDTSSGPEGKINLFLSYIGKISCNYPRLVLLVSFLLAGVSIWYTANHLQFDTNRRDLVSKNLPYEKLYEQYREKFYDFDGITVVVEGTNPGEMKGFADALAQKLESHPAIYSEILYKIDTTYFKNKALLYLSKDDLKELVEKIKAHQGFLDEVNSTPGLNHLMRGINSQISSGMVDTLLSDFLGNATEKKTDDNADLLLLTSILDQMGSHLNGETVYHSPWRSFLSKKEESLSEEGYLVSDDNQLMFMLISPKGDGSGFSGYATAISTIRQLIADLKPGFPHIEVGVTGSDVISSDEMETTQADVKLASVISLVGVVLLFFIAYKGFIKPLLAITCLIVALCWSMGFTTLVIGHLNILSIVSVTVLIGLGVDFGIHVLERFREEKSGGKDVVLALQHTLKKTGHGNLAGAIITAIAFFAMIFTDFTAIAELGLICGGGILLCFLSTIFLLPSMIILESKWRNHIFAEHTAPITRHPRIEKLFDHYLSIIGVSAVLLILSLFAFIGMKFDYNLLNLQAWGTEAVKYELKIINNGSHSTWYAAVVADSLEDAANKQKRLAALPTVGKVESIISVIPKNQEEQLAFIQTIAPVIDALEVRPEDKAFSLPELVETMKKIRFKLRGREEKANSTDPVIKAGLLVQKFLDDINKVDPATAQDRLNLFSQKLFKDYRQKIDALKTSAHPSLVKIEELPPLLKKRYLGKINVDQFLILVYPNINIWERDAMEEFLKELRKIDPNVTGNAVHLFESSQLMKNGYIHGGIYALVAIVIFVSGSFRNFRTTALILLPKVVGSIWTVGLMKIVGIQFNMANLIILPLISGIGLVNGIHIVHRHREDPNGDTSVLSKSTGQGVVMSSFATMIGFGSLMVANHRGIHSLGLLLTLGIGSSLLASVTLLPAMLKLCNIKGWKI